MAPGGESWYDMDIFVEGGVGLMNNVAKIMGISFPKMTMDETLHTLGRSENCGRDSLLRA